MRCPHCQSENSPFLPFARRIDGGRAFAQTCSACGHVLGVRPRIASDPPAIPGELSSAEAARLEFMKWRMRSTNFDRTLDGPDSGNGTPLSAA